MSPEVFHSDIFDVARQNMCCDIFAVNSLSPCLNAKTKNKTETVPCSTSTVLQSRVCFSDINCRLSVCVSHSETNQNKSKHHALLNDVHRDAVSVTSTAVLRFGASHQLPSVCFVCLGSVEIKHMHKKTHKKLFHAGLKNNVQTCDHSQTYIYKSRKHLQHTCPPLELCAVRRQDMPKKTSLSGCCTNS